jgi:hypothetical protein
LYEHTSTRQRAPDGALAGYYSKKMRAILCRQPDLIAALSLSGFCFGEESACKKENAYRHVNDVIHRTQFERDGGNFKFFSRILTRHEADYAERGINHSEHEAKHARCRKAPSRAKIKRYYA